MKLNELFRYQYPGKATHLMLNEDETEGPEWSVIYQLSLPAVDDDFDSDNRTIHVIFKAEDFQDATKYAEQYMRKMRTEEETSAQWANAEILSIILR